MDETKIDEKPISMTATEVQQRLANVAKGPMAMSMRQKIEIAVYAASKGDKGALETLRYFIELGSWTEKYGMPAIDYAIDRIRAEYCSHEGECASNLLDKCYVAPILNTFTFLSKDVLLTANSRGKGNKVEFGPKAKETPPSPPETPKAS